MTNISIWVLIVQLVTATQDSTSIAHEFTTLEKCENAGKTVEEKFRRISTVKWVCVEK